MEKIEHTIAFIEIILHFAGAILSIILIFIWINQFRDWFEDGIERWNNEVNN